MNRTNVSMRDPGAAGATGGGGVPRAGRAPRTAAGMTAMALLGLLLAAGSGGCKREDPQRAIDARRAAAEQEAETGAAAFEAAVAQQNWSLARAHGEVLLADHPTTEAAGRVAPQLERVREQAAAARDAQRLAGLWSYNTEPVKGGEQRSAALHAKQPLDVDGSGATPVRLIFRDHPDWGRSSYLVLQAGDFRCAGGCRVQVKVDDRATRSMAATRPDTDEAIAMFIDDQRALWRALEGAQLLSIEFPVRAGGTRTAVFEVGGLDRGRMPGWD